MPNGGMHFRSNGFAHLREAVVSVERSHGKPRPRGPRTDRRRASPTTSLAAQAGPVQDPKTGRFVPGNPGGRLRQARAIARAEAESLLRLAPEAVAPWLRGHLHAAQVHAQELVDSLGDRPDVELVALAGDVAKARLMAAACLTEGGKGACTPDEARAWRDEAKAWAREVRQSVLVFRAAKRETAEARPRSPGYTPSWLRAPTPPRTAPQLPATGADALPKQDATAGQPGGAMDGGTP